MKCPFCNKENNSVKDSRLTEENKTIRRRRQCTDCKGRFTTFERVQLRELIVVKKTGAKKPLDRNKIDKSISMALRKRNVSDDKIQQLTSRIVFELENTYSREVHSRKIGELIMRELSTIDPVAYIRFASVYKDFSTAHDFAKFVSRIKNI